MKNPNMFCRWLYKAKPYLEMGALQFGFAGMFVITMVSLQHGMNHYILAVYRQLIATLFITPFALVLERKTRPKMTLPIFLRILVLGFLEPVIDQNLSYLGMKYTSVTLASATSILNPAIIFVLALIFRLETVNLKKVYSLAKIFGTIIMVPGAVIMTLYKGPAFDFIKLHVGIHHSVTTETQPKHWVAGTLMLIARCWGWSGFYILQAFTVKMYPAQVSLTALICFIGAIGGAAVSLVMVRDINAWNIGWGTNLLAAAYTGVVCSGIAYYAQGAVIEEKGPVFVTAFSPLCLIITAALGSIILAEKIHLGSIIGTVLIVFGLYAVLWGKSQEDKQNSTTANDKVQQLPITDDAKSVNKENNMEGPARVLKIPSESPLTRETQQNSKSAN
ncbi:hypothetical protein PTKIN_Ptkin01aG0028800 [Pterospermum kingtungense]